MNNLKYFYLITVSCGFLLDCIDKLQGMSFFTQKLKQVTNRFIKELEKFEKLSINEIDADTLSQSYEVFGNILEMSLQIEQDKKEDFEKEITQLITKYKKNANKSND